MTALLVLILVAVSVDVALTVVALRRIRFQTRLFIDVHRKRPPMRWEIDEK